MIECFVVGEKLPWTAKLDNLTVYTIHHSEQMLYLLKPTSICATLAMTTKYRCLQTDSLTDSLSLLGFCLHADMQMVEMAVSNPQVCLYLSFTFSILYLDVFFVWLKKQFIRIYLYHFGHAITFISGGCMPLVL